MNFFNKQDKNKEQKLKIKLLQEFKKNIRSLKELYSNINKYPLANDVKQICIISDKIIKEVSLNQEKLMKANTFINYYLPTTIKILEQYIDIKENKLTGKQNDLIVINIENTLPKIKKAYHELLNKLFNDENKNIDIEIKVLISELENNSL